MGLRGDDTAVGGHSIRGCLPGRSPHVSIRQKADSAELTKSTTEGNKTVKNKKKGQVNFIIFLIYFIYIFAISYTCNF